jgi:hypothetical protein
MLEITIHSGMGQGLGLGLFGNSTPILYKWISCHISDIIIFPIEIANWGDTIF